MKEFDSLFAYYDKVNGPCWSLCLLSYLLKSNISIFVLTIYWWHNAFFLKCFLALNQLCFHVLAFDKCAVFSLGSSSSDMITTFDHQLFDPLIWNFQWRFYEDECQWFWLFPVARAWGLHHWLDCHGTHIRACLRITCDNSVTLHSLLCWDNPFFCFMNDKQKGQMANSVPDEHVDVSI